MGGWAGAIKTIGTQKVYVRPRQGLTQLPRKGAEAWPARCGGDLRSHRKPAGPAFRYLRSSAESPAAAQNQSPLKMAVQGQTPGPAPTIALPPPRANVQIFHRWSSSLTHTPPRSEPGQPSADPQSWPQKQPVFLAHACCTAGFQNP